MAATRNTNYYHMGLLAPDVTAISPPVYTGDYVDGLDSINERGRVAVPQGLGLGFEHDWDYIAANRSDYVEYK